MTRSVPASDFSFGLAPWTLAPFRAPYGFYPPADHATSVAPISVLPSSAFRFAHAQGLIGSATHLALMDTRELMLESTAQRWMARLPAATQARLARIRHPKRRAESLGGRLLASCFARILWQTLREEPPYSPLLESGDSLPARYDLSLAHSHGLAAMALQALPLGSPRPQVAIDLERVSPRPTIREIVSHSLGEAFWTRLSRFADDAHRDSPLLAFYRLWGEYECAIKLSRFSPSPFSVRVATRPEAGFTLLDPEGTPWASQAFVVAAPTDEAPNTPFVLTVTQRCHAPVTVYRLTLTDCVAYLD